MRRYLKDQRGFTLIEMIIVIILMGILAAVIVPQISMSTEDAKMSALKGQLATMRGAIEMYYIQHNNIYPGEKATDGGGGDPADDAGAAAALLAQLTTFTVITGQTFDTKTLATAEATASGSKVLGPYLKGTTFPSNPYNNATPVACTFATDDITDRTPLVTDPISGWRCYPKIGVFFANDSADSAAL
jgi:prepilin-type N-terminal cleavage/methylation domain-containing protein